VAIKGSIAARNAHLTAINGLVNAVAGQGGKLKIYETPTGGIPASPGTAVVDLDDLLATLRFTADGAFGAPSGGSMAAAAITSATAVKTGTATWFRVTDANDAVVYQGTITATGGGGDMEISNTSIVLDGTVAVLAYTLTAPESC
jgi:hypothetical protein